MKFKKMAAWAVSFALAAASAAMPVLAEEGTEAETAAASAAEAIDPSAPIAVTGGEITGTSTEDGAIAIFKGIPYAAPPVGDLRWKAPQDVEAWDGVKECTEFGPSAMQGAEGAFGNYTDEFLNSNRNYSEDSLTLNVWTETTSEQAARPVIVYIHGGGFTSGGSSVPIYDGELMARKGIVFVSINYRLSTFGFYASPELSAESEEGVSGNYAVLDWIKALQWVQDNISSFGGDPANVTVIGQSAGAGAVGTLTTSPLAAGLFKQAIGWSGLGVNAGGATLSDMETAGQELADAQGLDLAGMRALSADEVQALPGGFGTSIDGYAVTDSSLNTFLNGEQNDVATMTGMTSGDVGMGSAITSEFAKYLGMSGDEYTSLVNEAFGDKAEELLSIYPVNGDNNLGIADQANKDCAIMRYLAYAKVRATTAETPVFLYVYEHPYAGLEDQGAFHSSDIPYWLGGVFTQDKEFSDLDQEIASVMSGYLANFVATGDVNGEGLPEWPAYDGTPGYLEIADDGIEFVKVNPVIANFWDEYYSEMYGLEPTPVEVTQEDEDALAQLQEEMKAHSDEQAADIAENGITPDDPENPTLSIEQAEGNTVMVKEFAAGQFQPVSTYGMYPVRAYALDADGNRIGDLTIDNGVCDYSEYIGKAKEIGVLSSFTGKEARWTLPGAE